MLIFANSANVQGAVQDEAPKPETAAASLAAANQSAKVEFVAKVLPLTEEMRAAGLQTLQGISDFLNRRWILTGYAKRWYPSNVRNILKAQNFRNTMRESIRDGKSEIVAYREIGSGNREILRDKSGRIFGRFETDTGITRAADGKIIGRVSNQLLQLLK